MKTTTKSFIKRISMGGALSSAMSMLLGCAQIGEGPVGEETEPQTIAERLSKVEVCHEPPGNPDNVQTIEVGEAALGAHETQHGDDCGNNELPFDSLVMCHHNGDGTFSEVLVDGDSVSERLATGDRIGTCPQLFCGDS